MHLRVRAILPYFIRYTLIGGVVFCLDIGTFAYFLRVTWWLDFLNHPNVHRIWATILSLAIAFITHFTMNKHFNFRNFERSTGAQFVTYLVVAAFTTLVSIAVIETCVRVFGIAALVAKCIAVAVNIPIGFIGHKKLTFGQGLRALAIRLLRTA